jgi:hypothetical protein
LRNLQPGRHEDTQAPGEQNRQPPRPPKAKAETTYYVTLFTEIGGAW